MRLSAAIAVLDSVERSDPGQRDSASITLRAYAHQSRSYSLVRQATSAHPADTEFLRRAELAWDQGRRTLVDAGFEVPWWFFITPARIHIAHRQWSEAISELSKLEINGQHAGTALGVLAGAHFCAGHGNRAAEVLGSLSQLNSTSFSQGTSEAQRIQQSCALGESDEQQ